MPDPTPGPTPAAASNGVLAGLVGAALRRVHVPRLRAATGSAGAMSIGRLTLGDATIDRVIIQGVSASIATGRMLLEDVRSVLDLDVGVSYHVGVGLVSASGSPSVTLSFPFDIGTVDVPDMEDINLAIPSATVNDAEVEVQPIHNLNLGGARFSGLEMEDADLPAAGFGLSGLTLGPVELTGVTVPAVSVSQVSIDEFAPDQALTLPATEVRNINLPDVDAPRVSSVGAVDIENARASRRELTLVDIGILRITLFAEPTLHIHIGALTLNDLSASSVIDRIRLEDISAPITVRDITLGDLMLEEITVNQVTV